MPFCHKNNFCGPAREKTAAKSDDDGGSSIANESVITKSFCCCQVAKCLFHGGVPGLFSSNVANASPFPGPSACPRTAMLLAGAAAGTCTCEGEQDNLQCWMQAGFVQRQVKCWAAAGPSASPSQCSFPWESSMALLRTRLCTFGQWYIPPFTILQGAGVTSGFARNNPNPAELQLRADESCRTQPDSGQSQMDLCNLYPYHQFLLLVQLSKPTITLDKWGLVFKIITSVSWHFQDILDLT